MTSIWEAYRTSDCAKEDGICRLACCESLVSQGIVVFIN